MANNAEGAVHIGQAVGLLGLVMTGIEFHLDRIATAFELDEEEGEEWKEGLS